MIFFLNIKGILKERGIYLKIIHYSYIIIMFLAMVESSFKICSKFVTFSCNQFYTYHTIPFFFFFFIKTYQKGKVSFQTFYHIINK